jgi:O-antigen/teichoic acid export membrane protein
MTGAALRPENPAPPPAIGGMGRHAAAGSIWASLVSAVGKVTAAVSVVVMSHCLSEENYGTAALALSAFAWLCLVSPLTMSDVLVSHHHRLSRIAALAQHFFIGSALVSSIAFVAGTVLLCLTRPSGEQLVLAVLLFILGLRPWFECTFAIRLVTLRIALRYRLISTIDGVANLTGVACGIAAASLGAGPFSLVIPVIASAAARTFAVRKAAPPVSSARHPDQRLATPLRRALLRANFAQYVHNAVFVIDMLVLGWASNPRELGLFSFAFSIASQANAVIGFQLGSVLQPIFVQLRGDTRRESQAFTRVIRCIGALMVPISVVQASVGESLFGMVFPDRWGAAVPAFIALSLAQGFYFAVHPTMAFLKSRRQFAALLAWQLCHGAVAIPVLLACARLGGATSVAIGSAVLWAISVSAAAAMSIDGTSGLRAGLLKDMLAPWVTALPVGWAIHRFIAPALAGYSPWVGLPLLAALGLCACALLVALNRWTNPAAWRDILGIFAAVAGRLRIGRLPPRAC